MNVPDQLARRLASVRLVVCDVDGTLTDGGMWYGPDGEVLKRFHTRDGHGVALLRAAGIGVALVTSESSAIVPARALKLGIADVALGCTDKGSAVRQLRGRHGLAREEVAMIGDDLGDLPGFAECGVSVAVADAVLPVRQAATLQCERRGGDGAVRELCDAILEARRLHAGD